MSSDEDPIRKVTRADIESRVGANSRSAGNRESERPFSKNNNLAHAATGDARETRVLGGQLGSVSARRSKIHSSKLGWWILGAFIILIAVALIIPSPSEDSTISAAIEGKLPSTPEPDAIYRESRVDETTALADQPETSFIRPDDLGRVQAYAEEERVTNIIEDSLSRAQELETAGNLSIPADNNAASVYQSVLELDPSNSEATQGISRILATLLNSASQALSEDDRAKAQGILTRMQRIDGQNRRTLSLENALNQYQNQRDERAANIAALLQSAQNSLDEERVLDPARNNALYYYQQVLSIDSGNTLARGGIDRIITQQLELANQSILSRDLNAAIIQLNTVEMLSPQNPSLALLRAQIDALTAIPTEAQPGTPTEETLSESQLDQAEASVNSVTESPEYISDTSTEGADTASGSDTTNGADALLDNEATPEIRTENNSEVAIIETQVISDQNSGVLAISESDMTTGLEHYYHGRYDEAYASLKPLSDRGVARAQFRLAVMLQFGRGTTKDENAAEDLFRRTLPAIRASADAGADWAQADLASLYEDGMVVGQDIERAFSWYLLAAEQGYSGAQTNLGTLYYYGRGVEKSREKAIEWYRAAADQGDLVARENLSKLGVK